MVRCWQIWRNDFYRIANGVSERRQGPVRGRHLEGVVPQVEGVLPLELGFVVEHVCIYPANIKTN